MALAALAGCRPGAPGLTRLLDGLGEMLAIIIVATVVVMVLGVALAIGAFSKTMSALQESRVPEICEVDDDEQPTGAEDDAQAYRAAATMRAWRWALVLLLIYAGALALFSGGRYHHGSLVLVCCGLVPLGLLSWISVKAVRIGQRWAPLVSLPLLVAWGFVLSESWAARELSELPGRVVQLANEGTLACARLSTGQVSCFGNGVAGHGDARRVYAPTLVRDLEDALDVQAGDDITCALRREGSPVCWGTGDELPIPYGDGFSPWALEEANGAVELVPGRHQIVWRTGDGELGGWPEALPAGLSRADRLVGASSYFRAWVCAVQGEDGIRCWESESKDMVVLDVPPPEHVAMRANGTLCGVWEGAVRCYRLGDPKHPRELELENVQELLALQGFCARERSGRVWCWDGSHEPAVLLEGAEAIMGATGLVCAQTDRGRTCASLGMAGAYATESLLSYDRE